MQYISRSHPQTTHMEYEALLEWIRIANTISIKKVKNHIDLQLVVHQVSVEFMPKEEHGTLQNKGRKHIVDIQETGNCKGK